MQKNQALSKLYWNALIILILLPILFYFAYLWAYGVNVPFWDDWEIVSLMGHFYSGNLKFAQLWAQHNENRMLIPNLLFIGLYRLTSFNVRAALVASGIFLTLSFICFSLIFFKRRSFHWTFIPLAYLFFNFSDTQNILWGFQMAWQLVSFCFFASVACLEESGENKTAFAAAIFFAVLASFSSFQGLFVWPAGFVYLLFNHFSLRQRKIWISAALLSGIIYFTGFSFHSTGGPSLVYSLTHPLAVLRYLLIISGGISALPTRTLDLPFFITRGFLGLFILGAGSLSTFEAILESKKDKAFLLPASIGVFSLLFFISASIGRAGFGVEQALETRYSLYGIFLLIAIYLTLLEKLRASREKFLFFFRAFLIVMALQLTVSLRWGIMEGKSRFLFALKGQEILLNYPSISPNLISLYLYPRPNEIPPRAAILEKYHLSVFSSWQSRSLLPVPPTLKKLFKKNPGDWLIWRLLSTIYFYRPDLQKKFPPIPSEKEFTREIVSWADKRGTQNDPDKMLLFPWKKSLSKINRALNY